MIRRAALSILLCSSVFLGACESMEQAMTTTKDKIAALDLSMPSFMSSPEDPAAAEAVIVNNTQSENCPRVELIEELSEMHQFISPSTQTPEHKISDIEMTTVNHGCTHNKHNVIVELDMNFRGHLGPKAAAWNSERPSFAYPYFVAITDPDGNIVTKEIFAVTVAYNEGQSIATQHENIRQIIPITGDKFGKDYELLIGFQLTDAELAYNRNQETNKVNTLTASPAMKSNAGESLTTGKKQQIEVIEKTEEVETVLSPAPTKKPIVESFKTKSSTGMVKIVREEEKENIIIEEAKKIEPEKIETSAGVEPIAESPSAAEMEASEASAPPAMIEPEIITFDGVETNKAQEETINEPIDITADD